MHFVMNGDKGIGQRGPIRLRGFPAAAEAQYASGLRRAITHGGKHVRGLFLAAGAGGAGGNGKAKFVEFDDPALLAIGFGHQSGDGVPEAVAGMADDFHAGQSLQQRLLECFAPGESRAFLPACEGGLARPQGCEHGCDSGDILGASAASVLLRATENQRLETSARRAFQKANAFGAAKLVRATADEIALAQALRRKTAEPLRGIAEKRNVALTTELEDVVPRLQDASFIVRGHDCDQAGALLLQLLLQPIQVNHARTRNGDEAVALGEAACGGAQHTGMFDGGNPDLGGGIQRASGVVEHHVVGFSGAGSPDDVEGIAAQERGQSFAGFGQGAIGARTDAMRARGIAEELFAGVQPGVPRLGQKRRTGIVIEIAHQQLDYAVRKARRQNAIGTEIYLWNEHFRLKFPTSMKPATPKTLFYKQSHFVTHLPVDYRYTRSHFWAEQRPGNRLRLGFTKFATRMLGEMVDHKFDTDIGAPVNLGQILGWIEGFKAISDVICAGQGVFAGGNPALKENIGLVTDANYTDGWLYEIDGQLDEQSLDVHGYAEHLKATIDKMLERQKMDEDGLSSQASEA
ncbi:MAG: gcvH [Pedosphaera sp.]|nr:gcvH [Pedosphaera sp.]